MTKEEAVSIIEERIRVTEYVESSYVDCVDIEALRIAIKALQQPEPETIACGDCKHYICHDRRCGYWNHGVKPLEWCCHAERREEGDK